MNNVSDALEALKTGNVPRQKSGLRFLAQARLDPLKQGEVSAALNPSLQGSDTTMQSLAIDAAQVWATPKNVPALLSTLSGGDFQHVSSVNRQELRVLTLLGKLRDPRAIPKLMTYVRHPSSTSVSAQALVSIGKPAEAILLPRLHHPSPTEHALVRKLLSQLGTTQERKLDQTINDLGATDNERQKVALDWLGAQPLLESELKPVSDALAKLVSTSDRTLRVAALTALKTWSDKSIIPAVTPLLKSQDARTQADALALIVRYGGAAEEALIRNLLSSQGEARRLSDNQKTAIAFLGKHGSTLETATLLGKFATLLNADVDSFNALKEMDPKFTTPIVAKACFHPEERSQQVQGIGSRDQDTCHHLAERGEG